MLSGRFGNWLGRKAGRRQRANDPETTTHDTTTPPGQQQGRTLLGRRIIPHNDGHNDGDDDNARASTSGAGGGGAHTTTTPPLARPSMTATAVTQGSSSKTLFTRRSGSDTASPPRAYSRTPSPNLPPPPRKGKERAADAYHYFQATADDGGAGAGLLPTPDTEFNTFGRGRKGQYPGLGVVARAASPPTAFGAGGSRRAIPSGMRTLQRQASGGLLVVRPRRSWSQQEERRRQQQRRHASAGTAAASETPTDSTPTRSSSPALSSSARASSVGPARAASMGRLSSVPFTFGVARGRDTAQLQDRMRGGRVSLDSLTHYTSSSSGAARMPSLDLAVATFPAPATPTPLPEYTRQLTATPTRHTPDPASSSPMRFSFNIFGYGFGGSGGAATVHSSGSEESSAIITTTGAGKLPLGFPSSSHSSSSAAATPTPAASAEAHIPFPITTTTSALHTPEPAELGALAPRPPSPAPSAASHGSRFREMLEDDPDRASVVPPSPPHADPAPPLPPPAPAHTTRLGALFERTAFFGSGERSADGLRLIAKRGDRPVAGRRGSASRVLTIERADQDADDDDVNLDVTPPTPLGGGRGLGPAPVLVVIGDGEDEDDAAPATMSKKDGKRKASDPDSVESDPSSSQRVHTKSTGSASGGPAPSAFRQPKRIRLSAPAEEHQHDRFGSMASRKHEHSPTNHGHPPRPASRASTAHTARTGRSTIPVRAIVSPRPGSIAGSNRTFHLRDPHARAPPPVGWRPRSAPLATPHLHPQPGGKSQGTQHAPWTAWAFYVGFVLFPLWWVAALSPVRGWPVREKPDWAGWLEARDQRAWRRRCRWMSALALVVYVPLIALAAVFGPRATVSE